MTLLEAWKHWNEHNGQTQAAAIAFYAALSLAPLILLLLSLFGWLFGEDTLAILLVAREALGDSGAALVQQFLGLLQNSSAGLTVFGLATLLFSGSRVFAQLRKTLNSIWEVGSHGVAAVAKGYVIAVAMLLVTVGLVIASLVTIVLVGALAKIIGGSSVVWYLLSVILSLGFFTLAFALTFRYVPECELQWKHIWQGALVTAVLTEIGNVIIGIIIRVTGAASFYGIAGTLILLMLWIYYAMLVILFGASYTRVLGMTRNSGNPAA